MAATPPHRPEWGVENGGREPRPSVEDSRDVADLSWLTGLVGRLGKRIFPETTPGEPGADRQGAPTVAPPEPALSSDRDTAGLQAASATTTLEDEPEAPVALEPDAGLRGADATAGLGGPDDETRSGLRAGLERVRTSKAYRIARSKYAIAVAFAVFIGVVSLHNHFDGVDWGDDFALYLHQAKALAVGNIGEVLRDNRFTVDNSGWHSFSPYAYPWGWPVLMAPVYAAFGLSYGIFKFMEVVAFCVFLVVFYAIVRRRTGQLLALLLVAAIGVSRAFNGATDGVLSDIPYLCFVGLSLWWMDCCRERGMLALSRRRSIVLGVLIAYTYNIRREGLSLILALIALHVAVLAGVAVRERSIRALRRVDWKTLSVPYLAFGGFVIVFQLLLPTVFLPNAPGAGLSNISARLTYYQDVVAEHVGIKKAGVPMELFHSGHAAKQAMALLVILAIVGIVTRLLIRFEQDVHLAAYVVCTTFLMLISPYQDSRYFFTITPLLLYFAAQAFPATAELFQTSPTLLRLAVIPSVIGITGVIALNTGELRHAYDYHSVYHYTVNGPESPDAKQMFQALNDLSRGDDVILFFRARAMALYSNRRAIQGSNLDQLLKRSDWYVMAKDSTYSQTLLTDEEGAARGLTKAWENGSWVIWRVPPPP